MKNIILLISVFIVWNTIEASAQQRSLTPNALDILAMGELTNDQKLERIVGLAQAQRLRMLNIAKNEVIEHFKEHSIWSRSTQRSLGNFKSLWPSGAQVLASRHPNPFESLITSKTFSFVTTKNYTCEFTLLIESPERTVTHMWNHNTYEPQKDILTVYLSNDRLSCRGLLNQDYFVGFRLSGNSFYRDVVRVECGGSNFTSARCGFENSGALCDYSGSVPALLGGQFELLESFYRDKVKVSPNCNHL